jgi:hypothetical protein
MVQFKCAIKEIMPFTHHISSTRACLALSCAIFAGAAAAQAVSPTETTPTRPLVQVEYKSALSNFKPYTDQAIESWVKANDLVGRIGGWRSYAKEIATGEAVKDGTGGADPHAGHHKGDQR